MLPPKKLGRVLGAREGDTEGGTRARAKRPRQCETIGKGADAKRAEGGASGTSG